MMTNLMQKVAKEKKHKIDSEEGVQIRRGQVNNKVQRTASLSREFSSELSLTKATDFDSKVEQTLGKNLSVFSPEPPNMNIRSVIRVENIKLSIYV